MHVRQVLAGGDGGDAVHALLSCRGKRRCHGRAVNRNPDAVSGNRTGEGEEDKRASDQSRVEDVSARSAKDFFSNHDAEGNRNGDNPKRNRSGKRQREKHGCYEKALVDNLFSEDRKHDFPQNSDYERYNINRNEVHRAKDDKLNRVAEVRNRSLFRDGAEVKVPDFNAAHQPAAPVFQAVCRQRFQRSDNGLFNAFIVNNLLSDARC